MSTLFNPSKDQLVKAAQFAKTLELQEKNKLAAKEQLLRIQLLLSKKSIK